MLLLYTLQHFAVDGICGAILAAYAVNEEFLEQIIYYFCLYNAIAFGSQFFFGFLLDKRTNLLKIAPIISFLLLSAGIISELGILIQTILIGVGNSIFHVAAGSLILRGYKTYKEPGIFVSSGAIGLALGINLLVDAKIFLIICFATVIFAYRSNFQAEIPESDENFAPPMIISGFCVILLLGCVVLRSFGGGGTSSDYIMLFPCVFAAGKILGGLVCDKIGYKNTILLIFATGFLALQGDGLIFAVILTLAFNMTMPLTLRLIHWCNPNYPGMMFGLAAGCLLPGVFLENFSVIPHAMIVIQFLSLFLVGILFRRARINENVA